MKNISFRTILFCTLGCCMLTSCQQEKTETLAANYKTEKVKLLDIKLSTEYPASIKGKEYVDVRPQVSGIITKIAIDEGEEVRKGQTLFIIDQLPYQAALMTAEANVISAKSKVATAKLTLISKQELFKEKVISDFDLETAKNALQEAEAGLAQANATMINARNNLSYTVVKSPMDGICGMIPYKVGALVNSSITEPLVSISGRSEMYAYFSMTEKRVIELSLQNNSAIDTLENMSSVSLRLCNDSIYKYPGKIDAISGIINSQTGTVSIRAVFPNSKHLLKSGAAASIIIPYDRKQCIVIPKGATFEVQDKTYVYKVIDGKASSVGIKVFSIDDGKQYIVEAGLKVGDTYISEGAGLVREGSIVNSNIKQQNTK